MSCNYFKSSFFLRAIDIVIRERNGFVSIVCIICGFEVELLYREESLYIYFVELFLYGILSNWHKEYVRYLKVSAFD